MGPPHRPPPRSKRQHHLRSPRTVMIRYGSSPSRPPGAPHEVDEHSVAVTSSLGASVLAWFKGGNTIVRVAVLILFIGVAFLLRYAAEHTTVPIEWRLAGVALGRPRPCGARPAARHRSSRLRLVAAGRRRRHRVPRAVRRVPLVCVGAGRLDVRAARLHWPRSLRCWRCVRTHCPWRCSASAALFWRRCSPPPAKAAMSRCSAITWCSTSRSRGSHSARAGSCST